MKEPIAWMVVNSDGREVFVTSDPMLANVNLGQRALPLYTAPVMDTCADVRSSSPTAGGGFVERELAVARGLAACRGDDARLDEADTELADLRQACREGWRYADELEEERKRLQAELDSVKRYAAVAMEVCTSFSEEMKDGGRWVPRWKVLAVFATEEAATALADVLRKPAFDDA